MMKFPAAVFLGAWVAGCAAQTAADRGASIEDLARCQTEDCVLGFGPIVLKAYAPRPEGDRDVLYRVRRAPYRPMRSGTRDQPPPPAWVSIEEPLAGYSSSKAEIVFQVSYEAGGRIIQVLVHNRP